MPQIHHVYLILLHKAPEQARRLIARLARPGTRFLIHIDQRVDAAPFHAALAPLQESITYLRRFDSAWGAQGAVLATLEGLRVALADGHDWQYIHLISGQDYPIADSATIDGFFAAAQGKNFIEHLAMPVMGMSHGGMNRIEEYHFVPRRRFRARFEAWGLRFERLTNRTLRAIGLARRFPAYARPYVGSNWWSLTPSASEYILRFIERHPDYLPYHRHTLSADEVFFASILASTEDATLRASLVNENMRYVVWNRPGQTEFPAILRSADADEILRSGKLWARKFDLAVDAQVLDRIDEALAPREPAR